MEVCRQKPAIHRFPTSMGERVQKLYDLGVRNILVHDLAGESESLIQFAEEVMPHFLDKDDPVAQAAE